MTDPRRQARPVTPAQLDALATITEADLVAADLHAEQFGNGLLNRLVDAQPDPVPRGRAHPPPV